MTLNTAINNSLILNCGKAITLSHWFCIIPCHVTVEEKPSIKRVPGIVWIRAALSLSSSTFFESSLPASFFLSSFFYSFLFSFFFSFSSGHLPSCLHLSDSSDFYGCWWREGGQSLSHFLSCHMMGKKVWVGGGWMRRVGRCHFRYSTCFLQTDVFHSSYFAHAPTPSLPSFYSIFFLLLWCSMLLLQDCCYNSRNKTSFG